MPERSSKKRLRDLNQPAASIMVAARRGQSAKGSKLTPEQAAARLLGSKGGKKGGIARAAKLTAERRREIARKAAQVRWSGYP